MLEIGNISIVDFNREEQYICEIDTKSDFNLIKFIRPIRMRNITTFICQTMVHGITVP